MMSMNFSGELKYAVRSLARAKGLTITVVLTLALGIGANAAIFALVRGVLLRPLANRNEDRPIYIRQSARGIGIENAHFSVPEIQDLRAGVKTIGAFGVVGGSYFEVMGLHPVLGRLLDMRDDGPAAAGAMVLTFRFWTTALKSDAAVLGKTARPGTRAATIVGVLEPSVPYPAETEIIANVVTGRVRTVPMPTWVKVANRRGQAPPARRRAHRQYQPQPRPIHDDELSTLKLLAGAQPAECGAGFRRGFSSWGRTTMESIG